jgi:hypothetical protein
MRQKEVIPYACTQSNSFADTPHRLDTRLHDTTHTTPRMTTRITTPSDDESYPTTQTIGDTDRSDRAPMMFSPTSSATAGQFDTEADQPR